MSLLSFFLNNLKICKPNVKKRRLMMSFRKNLFFILLLLFFLSNLISCQKTTLDEKSILGDWEAIKGFYQQITFEIYDNEKLFYSFLDGKHFSDGTWQIKGNDIIIQMFSGEEEIFHNVILKDGILSFNNGQAQYQRLKTAKEKFEDLLKELVSSKDFNFSSPQDFEFDWNLENGQSTKIKGKILKAEVVLTTNDYTDINNAIKKVVEFLNDKDFYTSDPNTSEIIEGFENGTIKVIISQDSPSDYNPETDEPVEIKGQKATLNVMLGILE